MRAQGSGKMEKTLGFLTLGAGLDTVWCDESLVEEVDGKWKENREELGFRTNSMPPPWKEVRCSEGQSLHLGEGAPGVPLTELELRDKSGALSDHSALKTFMGCFSLDL